MAAIVLAASSLMIAVFAIPRLANAFGFAVPPIEAVAIAMLPVVILGPSLSWLKRLLRVATENAPAAQRLPNSS